MNLKAGVLTLLVIASGAHAANGVNFGQADNGSIYQLDAFGVAWRGSVAKVWVRGIYKNPNQYGVKSFVDREVIDCNDRDTITVLSDTSYDAYGNVVAAVENAVRAPVPIYLGGTGECRLLCAQGKIEVRSNRAENPSASRGSNS